MAKKPTITTVSTGYTSQDTINTNFENIKDAFDNTISRDGSTPNTMEADLDMNGNGLLNVGNISLSGSDTLQSLTESAETSATNAATSASEAETAKGAAEAAQAAAEAAENSLLEWQGAWTTATAYAPSDIVRESGSSYVCLEAHTSVTFSTDLSAGKWEIFAQQGAAGAGTGDMLAANNLSDVADANTSLSNLGGTTVGQAVFKAASEAAARTAISAQESDATLTALGGTLTAANKIPYATALDTAGELDFVDEDDMASNSATAVPSQQSVKAYVDTASTSVKIARINLSNQATAEFDSTNFDNATYDSYTVRFINVIPATDGGYLRFRSSSDGGTTFDSGASDYKVAVDGYVSDNTTANFADQNIGYGVLARWNCGNAAGEPGLSGTLDIYGPGDAVYTMFRSKVGTVTSTGDVQVSDATSVRLSAADVDGLQFYFSSGNLQSGSIVLIGHRA